MNLPLRRGRNSTREARPLATMNFEPERVFRPRETHFYDFSSFFNWRGCWLRKCQRLHSLTHIGRVRILANRP